LGSSVLQCSLYSSMLFLLLFFVCGLSCSSLRSCSEDGSVGLAVRRKESTGEGCTGREWCTLPVDSSSVFFLLLVLFLLGSGWFCSVLFLAVLLCCALLCSVGMVAVWSCCEAECVDGWEWEYGRRGVVSSSSMLLLSGLPRTLGCVSLVGSSDSVSSSCLLLPSAVLSVLFHALPSSLPRVL